MNGVQTVALFGQQNSGKSNSLLVLAENALGPDENLGTCPAPMAVIQCHYHTDASSYAPGFAAAFRPNDEAQGVTNVTRGRDMEAATDIHVLLQFLLGFPSPVYAFHKLLHDDEGKKLSKSKGSPSLASLRDAGWTAKAVQEKLGF